MNWTSRNRRRIARPRFKGPGGKAASFNCRVEIEVDFGNGFVHHKTSNCLSEFHATRLLDAVAARFNVPVRGKFTDERDETKIIDRSAPPSII